MHANPPDTVPEYLAVIVTDRVEKAGPVSSGTIRKIVIVKTNPGYGPNPGHAGLGTVVATLCTAP